MLSGKLGQIAAASGTNARTGGTFVPLVTQLNYIYTDHTPVVVITS